MDLHAQLVVPVQKRLERYKNKNLNLILDCPEQGTLLAPRHEFTRSLVHLVDNAFKFSPENGNIQLSVALGSKGSVTILVQDEGPGIPADLREKVFERFYQISQGDNREYDGLGVGLTIARAVFRGLGGTAEIMDSPKGCMVRAWLPESNPEDLLYG